MPAHVINSVEFEKYLQEQLLDQVYSKLLSQTSFILTNVKTLVKQELEKSETYSSLLSGKLRSSFGLADSKTAIGEITQAVVDSSIMTVGISTQHVSCVVMVLKDDFSEVLNTEGAKYTYNARPKTTPAGRRLVGGRVEIPWLEWLLFRGDSVIIADAQIATVPPTQYSRTNTTVMIHPKSPKGWSVPPEYSGVQDSNWLTKVLEPLAEQVIDEIWKAVNV